MLRRLLELILLLTILAASAAISVPASSQTLSEEVEAEAQNLELQRAQTIQSRDDLIRTIAELQSALDITEKGLIGIQGQIDAVRRQKSRLDLFPKTIQDATR